MPVIRVSHQVQAFIFRHGKFGDSPDGVLRRLLKLPKTNGGEHAGPGNHAAKHAGRLGKMRHAALRALLKAEGQKLQNIKLVDLIARQILGKQSNAASSTSAGKPSDPWMARLKQARKGLIRDGLVKIVSEGQRNFWKLTPLGVKRASALKAKGAKRPKTQSTKQAKTKR